MADARSTALLDMTLLPPLGEVLDLAAAQLAAWMPNQRWYAHKGAGTPQVEVAGWAPLRIAPDHATVLLVAAVHLGDGDRLAAGGAADGSVGNGPDGAPVAPGTAPGAHPGPTGPREPDALYQVPLVLRRPEGAPAPEEGAEIGVLAVSGGPLRVDDATRDADGRAALVATLVSGDGAAGPGLSLASHRTRPGSPLPLGRAMRSRVLAGEQSNTSLIIETEGTSPLIVKLFRVLQDGENPDAALQGALTAQGSAHVPAVVGAATVRTGAMRTHALVAQEFLPQVEDAWRVALRLARAGEDFTAPARALGTTLAEVHRDLAAALGTVAADEGTVRAVLAQMHRRLAQVAAEVEQVAAHRERLAALLDTAAGQTWPAMQRIHGDLHLGQVLASPERGWVLLDFEGEPLRPLAERALPDSPLRDVAGMLRSLDYVAGAVALEHGVDAGSWAADARAAFLEGWAAEAGTPAPAVLAAFEADKAVYEALYESRQRPDWLPIPLGALERISARGAGAGSAG
ncbi:MULTISPECIES: phosphotransferase [Brachybacterium]|uniref:phosphotransferase n=1 Tax=Brachybacterium TaxID=43668 RepID=UPI00026C6BEC|nr:MULTISPECIES: phosphotransferase [Brachybacterium]TDP80204.1 putative trehalose synthase [Brachybacterium sp. AG952]